MIPIYEISYVYQDNEKSECNWVSLVKVIKFPYFFKNYLCDGRVSLPSSSAASLFFIF